MLVGGSHPEIEPGEFLQAAVAAAMIDSEASAKSPVSCGNRRGIRADAVVTPLAVCRAAEQSASQRSSSAVGADATFNLWCQN